MESMSERDTQGTLSLWANVADLFNEFDSSQVSFESGEIGTTNQPMYHVFFSCQNIFLVELRRLGGFLSARSGTPHSYFIVNLSGSK